MRLPVLLFIEDAHYLDEDSKAFLYHLKRALKAEPASCPVAILLTTRWQGTEEMLEEGLLKNSTEFEDRTFKMVACRSAVMAGDRLEVGEMMRMIKELFECENPYNCPHGRPTLLKISKGRLERDFLRT